MSANLLFLKTELISLNLHFFEDFSTLFDAEAAMYENEEAVASTQIWMERPEGLFHTMAAEK